MIFDSNAVCKMFSTYIGKKNLVYQLGKDVRIYQLGKFLANIHRNHFTGTIYCQKSVEGCILHDF